MADKPNFEQILEQAKQMQTKMQSAQEALAQIRVTGVAGGDLMEVEVDGRHNVIQAKANPNLADEDLTVICDLFVAAANDANRKLETASKEKIKSLTQDIQLPPDLFGGGDNA